MELKTKKKITNDSSIIAAELVAIREAINETEEKAKQKDKMVILTDSLAASISIKKLRQTANETESNRRDNGTNSHTQTPKGDNDTHLQDPSTLRNKRLTRRPKRD